MVNPEQPADLSLTNQALADQLQALANEQNEFTTGGDLDEIHIVFYRVELQAAIDALRACATSITRERAEDLTRRAV